MLKLVMATRIPFSVLARHGFIAKSLLDSIVSLGILTVEDVERFQKTIPTVATEFIRDLNMFSLGQLEKEEIIDNYGHLRPGTYDILSIPYKARDDLIIKEKNVQKLDEEIPEFELSEKLVIIKKPPREDVISAYENCEFLVLPSRASTG